MNDIKVMNHAADNIRILAAAMVEKANSGHPGGAMGGADFINVLFAEYLVYDPSDPTWTLMISSNFGSGVLLRLDTRNLILHVA